MLTSTDAGKGVGTLAVDAARGLVYAATKEPSIVTLRADAETGALTEVARREIGEALAYVTLTEGGAWLLGASYDGGVARTWPVRDGVLGEPVGEVRHANCHCVRVVGDRVYVVALGDDIVAQYRLGASGELTPMDPPSVAAPKGSGPRHLVLDGEHAYLVTEYSAEVIRFDVAADGTLTRREAARIDDPAAGLAHSVMGADPAKEHLRWGAEVVRAGRWVFASERTASTIATVALGSDGTLGDVVAVTPTEKQPRAFVATPDAGHLIAVGEKSPEAALYRIEPDGALTPVGTAAVGETARWVAFV